MTGSLKTSIVIVTYNSTATIADCLDSLGRHQHQEVVVVDNASTDETLGLLKSFDWIKVLPQTKNLGYSGGNQVGIEASSGEIVVLLNPDTLVPPGFSRSVTQLVDQHPEAGAIGCGIKNSDGSVEVTASRFPTFGSLLYEFSSYQKFFPRSRAYRNYLMLDWNRLSVRRVDAVSGACTIIRRPSLNRIGAFDTGFFLFFEELDLGQRLKRIGQAVVYDPAIFVTHLKGVSTREVKPETINRIFLQSRDHYIRKYHGAFYLALFKLTGRTFDLAWSISRKLGIGYNR